MRCAPCSDAWVPRPVHYTEEAAIAGVVVEDVVQFAHARDHVEGDPSAAPNPSKAVNVLCSAAMENAEGDVDVLPPAGRRHPRRPALRRPHADAAAEGGEDGAARLFRSACPTCAPILMGRLGVVKRVRTADARRDHRALCAGSRPGRRPCRRATCTPRSAARRSATRADKRFARLFPSRRRGVARLEEPRPNRGRRTRLSTSRSSCSPTIIESVRHLRLRVDPSAEGDRRGGEEGLTAMLSDGERRAVPPRHIVPPAHRRRAQQAAEAAVCARRRHDQGTASRTPSTTKKLLLIKPQQYMVSAPAEGRRASSSIERPDRVVLLDRSSSSTNCSPAAC